MLCLVTGASGYLGSRLVPALVGSDCRVIAALRAGGTVPGAERVVAADLADADALEGLREAMDGVDVVVHLAGIAHQQATAAAYQSVNLDASIDLAEAARERGVKRFIFVSSVKAIDAEVRMRNRAQTDAGAADAPLDYGASKLAAEHALRERLQGSSTELVIVRPALVYGGDAAGHLGLLRRWVERRMPAPPGGGCLSMIARDDLIALLCILVRHEGVAPALITATDGERYDTRRLHAAYCRALDRQPWLPSPPAFVWRTSAAVWDRLRGEASGNTWQRLAGQACHESSGTRDLVWAPTLTWERSLGL